MHTFSLKCYIILISCVYISALSSNEDISEDILSPNNYVHESDDETISSIQDEVKEKVEYFYKNILGDVIANQSSIGHRQIRPSRYMLKLFSILQSIGEVQIDSNNLIMVPAIRSYTADYEGADQQRHGTLYIATPVKSSNVRRMEIVIRFRRRKHPLTANTYTFVMSVLEQTDKDAVEVRARTLKDYLIFDISHLKDIVLMHSSLNLSLRADGKYMNLTKVNEILLVVYENLLENPLLENDDINSAANIRRKRNLSKLRAFTSTDDRMEENDEYHCARYDWHVDMAKIISRSGWLLPVIYNAGYCQGECRFPLDSDILNTTNYAFIKDLYHIKTHYLDSTIPRTCCTPVDYYSQYIMYISTSLTTVVELLSNMRVKSCGCR